MAGKPRVLNPSDPVLWCREAAARIEAGDPKGAIYCYQESLKIRPDVPDVWYNLGLLLETIGQQTAALGCYTKSSEMFPGDYRFFAERARLLAESGKYLDAVVAAGDALAVNPHAPQIHANRAGYLIRAAEMRREQSPRRTQRSLLTRQTRQPSQTKQTLWWFWEEQTTQKQFSAAEKKRCQQTNASQRCSQTFSCEPDNGTKRSQLPKKSCTSLPKTTRCGVSKVQPCAYLGRKDEAVAAFGTAMKINPKEKSYKHNRDAIKKS